MSVIDSKKLLPPSKKGGSIEKQKFLVPLQNISVKKISAGDLKPVDKELKTTGNLVGVRRKITELSVLFKDSYLIDKKERETKRKEEERRKSEQRERKLEKKVKDNKVSSNLIPSIPGQSIFDRINRFIGFTLLGYLFNKYGELLPKLIEFGKVLKPVAEFIESFAKNLLSGVINFVEFGYKAYDGTRNFVKELGGEGAAKTFDDFSKQLNLLLNGAIAASMLIISSSPKKPGGPIKPGAKPSTLPKNAKLSGYLGRDPQTKMIERRYGNDAARMYESRKAQGATVSRARADVLKRFEKLEGPQRGLAGGTGKGSVLSRGLGKSANRAALKVLGKTGTKIARGVFGRVPIIGGLLDFAFSLAMGENPGRAAAKAVGATVGSALGTFIPVPFAGTILGGILGDIVGGALYDSLIGSGEKPQGRAEGGRITRGGQSSVASSRRLKTRTKKVTPRIQPQKTQPGKDVGGKLKIEELYGKDEPGTRSALRALKKSSEDVKKMRSINGLTGSMFGAGIDMALGQKPDKKLAKSIGDVFGSVVQNAVDLELNKSFGDISKTIAMAGGGAVPTREIGRQLSIGERIGKFISSALAISIESSASKILQNLNRELNLEGGPPGGDGNGGAGDGGGAGTVSVSSDSPDFWLLAVGSLLENSHPQGSADVAQVIYNRVSSSSWPSTIRGVILEGNGGQFQPVRDYGNISAWKSIKDKQSAIDFIKKYGKGRTQSQLETVADALLNSGRQSSARTFVGPRDSFRSTSFEDKNDHLADDTEQRRHGHVFGFEPRGAQIDAFRSGKLVPAQVSDQTKGTVTQLKPKGLPLTGENGRLKPSQLTRVGTLIGGVDYQDWYGNGAYLRNDAAAAFLAAKEQAKKEGISIPITSAYRSLEHQKAIQGKYAVVAAPGTSRHGEGTALDIQTGTAGYSWFVQNGPTYGWRYMAIPGDPVHFEYVGGFTPSKKQNQIKLSPIFDRTQASLAPSQSSAVASLNKSGILKEDTSTFIYNNNTVAFVPIETPATVA